MRACHLMTYPECRICGLVDPSNHVHHLRYRGEKGVDEKPGDLVTLCQFHHEDLHRQKNTAGGALVRHTLDYISHAWREEDEEIAS